MAAEAAPPPSFEAQHHEEYIDYSEDDAPNPTAAAQGSNHSSFSANAHFVADVSENAETNLQPDHQTIDVQVAAETVAVASDAQLEGRDYESADAANSGSANLIEQDPEEVEGASFNENEISWEDGPNYGQSEDQGNSHLDHEKGDWQLVDEGDHFAEDDQDFADGATADVELNSQESEKGPHNPTDIAEDIDTSPQETAVDAVDHALPEQAAGTQDTEADGDLHEIDYFEDGNAAADPPAEAAETQQKSSLDRENLSNDHSDPSAEDRAMGEGPDSPSQHEAENTVVEIDDDDADAQELDGQAGDEQEYVATGDNTSVHEQMEYEDEARVEAQSPVSVDTPSNEDMEIPVITVSYKGVEYPFFYNSPDSEGKECFFDDLSLLHCKMEGVLAGFRRELASELGPFDELVFQIDELGLEFAESSQPEMFSDITLGQVISVFDSLVKNQDPDASKPLYAFLVTRPNCKKRWLSLVDDAYNGKGLDEVGYYFASQAHSEAPEIMDDEPGMIGEEDNAEAAAWPNSPAESGQGDQNDQDDNQSQAEDVEANGEDDDVGDGLTEEDENQAHDTTAVDEAPYPELTSAEEVDAETTMVDTDIPLMDESTVVADIDNLEGNDMTDMMEDQEPQTYGENAPETDNSNPLVNWDTEEVDLLNMVGDDQHLPDDEGSSAVVDQSAQGPDENSANKVTPNTSATSTLNGDEVTYDNNELDLNADIPGNGDDGAAAAGQDDELAEIDWREFPGEGDDELAESPSVFGKRPRSDVDDLLDDEAQKDVKRRRS